MIKISKAQGRVVRETTCPFLIVTDEKEVIEMIRVRYFSLSIKEMREFGRKVESNGDSMYMSDLLLPLIESLPDIVDDDEKPVTVTLELLDSLNAINVRALHKAIQDDIAGPKTPAKQ